MLTLVSFDRGSQAAFFGQQYHLHDTLENVLRVHSPWPELGVISSKAAPGKSNSKGDQAARWVLHKRRGTLPFVCYMLNVLQVERWVVAIHEYETTRATWEDTAHSIDARMGARPRGRRYDWWSCRTRLRWAKAGSCWRDKKKETRGSLF